MCSEKFFPKLYFEELPEADSISTQELILGIEGLGIKVLDEEIPQLYCLEACLDFVMAK